MRSAVMLRTRCSRRSATSTESDVEGRRTVVALAREFGGVALPVAALTAGASAQVLCLFTLCIASFFRHNRAERSAVLFPAVVQQLFCPQDAPVGPRAVLCVGATRLCVAEAVCLDGQPVRSRAGLAD